MMKRTLFKIHRHLILSKNNNTSSFSTLTRANRQWFATKYTADYTPPESQLSTFEKLMSNIENKQSMQAAARSMASLQADGQLYRERLLSMQSQIDRLNQLNPQAAKMLNHNKKLEIEINSYIEEGKDLQQRATKQLDKIKAYGISKIAKEVIEISDHLTQSIALLQKQSSAVHTTSLKQLKQLHQQLSELFHKYQIHQFDPKNEVFDPNLHQSVGHLQTDDPAKVNLIAQTKRTGFKLKDRLLRSAFVVIYK